MPVIPSQYKRPPFLFFNKHIETIYPSAIRKAPEVPYERERITTDDGDFLDIDWVRSGNKRLIIISHGLEGSSHRPYVTGMAKLFSDNGWDALGWNCRSCSGEMNQTPVLYHHGFTIDLDKVVHHAIAKGYETITLAGFSMGGSLTLKYVGENGTDLPSQVKAATAFSVPCRLVESSSALDGRGNGIYKNRFLKKLKEKIMAKAAQFPDQLDIKGIDEIADFDTFDTRFTAPMFGFKDARDFYEKVECYPYLPSISIPTLLVNAANDPMLKGECYPVQLAENHSNLYLEIPARGGHVGFMIPGEEHTYAEKRALSFVNEHLF